MTLTGAGLLTVASLLVRSIFAPAERVMQHASEPMISILIAARNEEANVARCLDSVLAMDYPKDRYEVLVGNDSSEDGTLSILERYSREQPHVRVFDIRGNLGLARGKGNVLAHLARQARGDYFLMTDADIAVPRTWAKALLEGAEEGVGVVTGIITVEGGRLLNKLEALDVLYAMTKMKIFYDARLPVTTMGNNMLVTRQAYEAVGGYEHIPFSLIEDYALFRAIIDKGWQCRQLFNRRVLAISRPVTSLRHMLDQRKRWLKGGVQLPLLLVVALGIQGVFYPAVIALTLLNPAVGLSVWICHLLLQSAVLALSLVRLGKWPLSVLLPLYELYELSLALMVTGFANWPGKVRWKGRAY